MKPLLLLLFLPPTKKKVEKYKSKA